MTVWALLLEELSESENSIYYYDRFPGQSRALISSLTLSLLPCILPKIRSLNVLLEASP